MNYLFSSESVSEGHPDKVADQISDALVDQFLAYDANAHCAIESFVTTGQVVIMGEVRSEAYIDLQTIARKTINQIGYNKSEYQFDGNSCGVLTAIHEQSDDINRGVSRAEEEEQGAGDQGMMFGYATNETENYMPVTLDLAQLIMRVLADIRKEGKQMTYLRPDSKSQVTVEYSEEGIPQRIDTIVVSTQHDEFDDDDERMLAKIKDDVLNILMPRVKAEIHSEKVDKLAEIVEAANGSSVLVFYQFKHDIPRITKKLKGYRVEVYEGEKQLMDWNAGKIDVLLAHPASTAYGLNMQAGGHYIVWFGTGWDLELFQQANARLHRQGQKHPVTVYKLIGKNTVDERTSASLENKKAKQQSLLDSLNYLIRKHSSNV